MSARCAAWLSAGAALVVLCASAPATADKGDKSDKSGKSDADKKAAQRLLNEGNQLWGDGEYLEALERFKAAYARYQSPKILLNIGTTLRQLGRSVEAAAVYATYLDAPDADPKRLPDVQRIVREIEAVIGKVQIEAEDGDASVRLDGRLIEDFKSGMAVRVEPGQHTVVAERAGFPPVVQTLTVEPGATREIKLRFERPKPAQVVVIAPPPSHTQRDAGLTLGGIGVLGLGAGVALGLLARSSNDSASKHCLNGGTACDKEGEKLSVVANLEATASTVAFTVGGAALTTGALLLLEGTSQKVVPTVLRAADLGTGVTFAVLARAKNSAAAAHCEAGGTICDPEGVKLGLEAKNNARLATAAFGAAGAAIAAEAIVLLAAPPPRKAPATPSARPLAGRVWIAPAPSAEGAWLTVGGRW